MKHLPNIWMLESMFSTFKALYPERKLLITRAADRKLGEIVLNIIAKDCIIIDAKKAKSLEENDDIDVDSFL